MTITATTNPDYISVMSRRDGYTAVLMRWSVDKKIYRPAQFGKRGYLRKEDAIAKATEWAASIGITLKVRR